MKAKKIYLYIFFDHFLFSESPILHLMDYYGRLFTDFFFILPPGLVKKKVYIFPSLNHN